jgi:hypothetical protein
MGLQLPGKPVATQDFQIDVSEQLAHNTARVVFARVRREGTRGGFEYESVLGLSPQLVLSHTQGARETIEHRTLG